ELDKIQISVATAAEYKAFGLGYLPALQNLNFNLVGPNSAGQVKVLISTREPITEPYLELLLLLRWPAGSLQREYVLLFDLPAAAPIDDAFSTRGYTETVQTAVAGERVVVETVFVDAAALETFDTLANPLPE